MAPIGRRAARDPRVNAPSLIAARIYTCACCAAEVLICPACDRGQRYCGKACREQARRVAQRSASKKYQSTRAGKVNHARRQGRYRERGRQTQREIVTHQGSQEVRADDLLQSRLDDMASAARQSVPGRTCRWCGRPVTGVVRRGWLRHAAFEQALAHELKGVARAQSP